MSSQNVQNPMPFHPNTWYWAEPFHPVSLLEQQSSPNVQSQNAWPSCDFRADSTPSCFCIINSGRPPLIGEGGEHMPLTFWPSVVDELRFPADSVELNHHDLISSSTPCLVPCVLLWYEQVWKSWTTPNSWELSYDCRSFWNSVVRWGLVGLNHPELMSSSTTGLVSCVVLWLSRHISCWLSHIVLIAETLFSTSLCLHPLWGLAIGNQALSKQPKNFLYFFYHVSGTL